MIIDCLSIISIHILTETSEPSSKIESGVLLAKILNSVDLVNFVLSLLQTPGLSTLASFPGSQMKEDPLTEVRKYALKFLQMLIYISPEFEASFEAKGAYKTLTDFISQPKNGSLKHLGELETMES